MSHINTPKLDSTHEARTIKKLLESYDPMRLYFSSSDIKDLTQKLKELFKKIKKADCSPLFSLRDSYIKKVRDRVRFANGKLNKSFKLDRSVRILLDPEKRGYAKTKKGLRNFRKSIFTFRCPTTWWLEKALRNL